MTVRSLVALAVTLMPLVGCTDEGPPRGSHRSAQPLDPRACDDRARAEAQPSR